MGSPTSAETSPPCRRTRGDLKPANIKVRDDDTVKVLDFGLAKAVEGDGSGLRQQDPSPSLMNSPTMTSPAMTREGVILGTAAYMAPEQAKGRFVDKRADVWAFGVVFYEMLTGRGLFHGDTLVETLAQVMTHEPPLDALPATVPPAIRQLLARCLQRDPRQRLRDIGEARILLASPEALAPPLEFLNVDVSGPPERIELDAPLLPASWSSSNVLALLGPGHRRIWTMPMDGSNAPSTFVETSADQHFPTFSPDGKWLAYTSNENGRVDVYIRPYPEGDPVVGISPSGGTAPAWSRDGKALFYKQGDQLVSVGVTTQDGFRRTGPPRPLFDVGGSTAPLP